MAKSIQFKCPQCGTQLTQQMKGCPKCRLQNPFYGTNREEALLYAKELRDAKKRSHINTVLSLLALILFAVLLNLFVSFRTAKQLTTSLASDEVRNPMAVAEENYDAYGIQLEEYLQAESYTDVAAFVKDHDLMRSDVYRPYRLIFEESLHYREILTMLRDKVLGETVSTDHLTEELNAFYRYADPLTYVDENGDIIEVEETRTLRAFANMDRDIRYMLVTAFGIDDPGEAFLAGLTEDARSTWLKEVCYEER